MAEGINSKERKEVAARANGKKKKTGSDAPKNEKLPMGAAVS